MGLEVLVIAFVFYLMADTVTRGKVTAVMRGTAKGTAKTAGRAAREGARRAHAEKLAYLDSGKAPLGKTRRRAGKIVSGARRAAWEGAVDGVRSELEQLREAIERAREEAERARADAQQPRRGRFGHSFDVIPDVTGGPTRDGRIESPDSVFGRCPKCRRIVNLPLAPDGTVTDRRPPLCEPCAAEQLSSTPYGPDATAPGAPTTAPTGQEGQITMSAGTMTGGSGGPHVEVRSLPGFITACDTIAALIVSVSEQATGEVKLEPAAQAGLVDAGDLMRSVAQSARQTYAHLIEAADATPQGAEGVTVGKARTE
jgi:hypothetical protein